eukprot:CAMPEP_0198124208 /NCGR_PEP_ID=MMETSP1442-20131203/39431_1 /TAXON_ID= /ORGANISM="Craspedostauros australis, Strain CCMP3328" /LENGTH=43 /DNA_ID= /DNA_START= /DNA_END= /DNA_ORIENTATION=
MRRGGELLVVGILVGVQDEDGMGSLRLGLAWRLSLGSLALPAS